MLLLNFDWQVANVWSQPGAICTVAPFGKLTNANVISACVLGGVSLLGGRATISGVVIGVLIMGTVENVMNFMNIDAFYQYLVRGAILLAAVLLDQLKNRGTRD